MRVISGIRRGHKLKAPKGYKVRPTEDRVKESLFNILNNISSEAIVLDAFSGSGSIGIEFLSRGAKECHFVDKSRESIKVIRENIEHTKFKEQSIVMSMGIERYIGRLSEGEILFDYVYIDPPYDRLDLIVDTMNMIYDKKLYKETSLLIVEHIDDFKIQEEKFELKDVRKYGGKYISFYNIKKMGGIR